MAGHRPPTFACWQSLLAVPLLLFVFVLILLLFFSPESGQAQMGQVQAVTELANGGTYDHVVMAPSITAQTLVSPIEIDGVLVGASVFLGSVQQWSNFWVSSTPF